MPMRGCPSSVSLDFCRRVPKVELHAHLNGSLGPNAVAKLQHLHQELFPDENIGEKYIFMDLADARFAFGQIIGLALKEHKLPYRVYPRVSSTKSLRGLSALSRPPVAHR